MIFQFLTNKNILEQNNFAPGYLYVIIRNIYKNVLYFIVTIVAP